MKTLLADTNIFLRFLTKDVLEQAVKVKKIFHEAERGRLKIIILHVTIVEIIFHLENWYQFSKEEAVKKLWLLFSPSWIEIEDKITIFSALEAYKDNSLDFVDLIVWWYAKKINHPILSFDKDYDRLTPKIRLEP